VHQIKSLHKDQGFTLIEVLVAMAITVIVAAIAYSTLDSAIKMSEVSERQADQLQRMNRAFDVLAKDFRHVIGRKVRSPDGYETFESAFTYENDAYPMLQFSRTGWLNPQPKRFQRSNMQRVAYHFEEGKLTRFSWAQMDRYTSDEPRKAVLFDGIKRFELRLFRIDANIAAGTNINQGSQVGQKGDWVIAWPAESYTGPAVDVIPAAVEVTLEHEQWGTVTRIFEVVDSVGVTP
jgi:general secretion pathway protein J